MFELVMRPGSGPGARADELVEQIAGPDPIEPGSAVHIARAETPRGSVDLVSFQMADTSTNMAGLSCVGTVSLQGGSSACSAGPAEDSFSGIEGWGSDGTWNETQFYGPDGTVTIEATAADGTTYTIQTQDRWGVLVWAAIHGELVSVLYRDNTGAELRDS